jgi:hypothetical protein
MNLILILISLFLFTAYNAVALKRFGVPKSLSDTFYLWNSVKKNLGYIFTGMMGGMAFTLLPAWIEVGNQVSSWSPFLNFLAFFTCGAIVFVGAAPAFRSNKMEGTVHEVSAKIAAACALIWCFVVCYQIWYVPLACIIAVLIAGLCTRTFKKCLVYWLEMMAFAATFMTVIAELILQSV